ncbi:N-acetylmuramoyl-L-alanine amidase LytC precursor [Clostridium acetireducens DSM 10703]|uniref:N-acetylmuramoyl-L-alanine amidase LytC n=1 Tax=Clostridium acetireducens DSM 10703 TaxID=1121290 RepID=A0A1E8EY18_9CLOT|nr:cell wall-binding repeat-containing protein [Clostridium acetireducens]OFI05865.1 N-acetylmuramoyl-L-alanine amidase LytC precursor [Clostridium acetireducens DSM 10703]
MLKNKKALIISILIFIGSTVTIGNKVQAKYIERKRIWGEDRYKTAVEISKEHWKESYYAVLVNGTNFPDALSAAPLARKYDAPILYTDTNYLNISTRKRLIDLKVRRIFIIGGKGVVSQNVENELNNLGFITERFEGKDRYETSTKVAEKVGISKTIYLATGEDFADAISIAPIAARDKRPLLLVPKDHLPNVTKEVIKNKKFRNTYVVGDHNIISDNVVKEFDNVDRIAGNSKYDRNANVINKFNDELHCKNMYIASGEKFPDALAGAAAAAKEKSPVVIINPWDTKKAQELIHEKNAEKIKILGGYGAIPDSAVTEIAGNEGIVDGRVSFSDDELKWAVENEVGKHYGNIYRSDVLKITSLEVYGRVEKLDGIEELKNLKTLKLNYSKIKKLEPLTKLNCLTELELISGEIENIDELKKCYNLKKLTLNDNKIKDITPLENLENLEYLYLEDNEIRDITPLRNLTNIRELSLKYNEIIDIRPLENLNKIRILYLNGNEISNYDAISRFYKKLDEKDFYLEDSNSEDYDDLDGTSEEQIQLFENKYNNTYNPYKVLYHSCSDYYFVKELNRLSKIRSELLREIGDEGFTISFRTIIKESLKNTENQYNLTNQEYNMNKEIRDLEQQLSMALKEKEKREIRNKINATYAEYRYKYYSSKLNYLEEQRENLENKKEQLIRERIYSNEDKIENIEEDLKDNKKELKKVIDKKDKYYKLREFFNIVDSILFQD